MPRRKTNKEYAIRLVHPDLGEYYFNYNNTGDNYAYYNNKPSSFMFTQTLKKVNIWKTLSVVEAQILQMIEDLNSKKGKILIPFGSELNENWSEKAKANMIFKRKKYYYQINNIVSKYHIDSAKSNIKKLDETLLADSIMITEMIKNSLHLEKDFMKKIKQFENDINSYRKDYSLLDKHMNFDVAYLDIVDASYGFRYLKLKTLKELSNENETELK